MWTASQEKTQVEAVLFVCFFVCEISGKTNLEALSKEYTSGKNGNDPPSESRTTERKQSAGLALSHKFGKKQMSAKFFFSWELNCNNKLKKIKSQKSAIPVMTTLH